MIGGHQDLNCIIIVFKEPDSNDIAYVERVKPYVKNSIYSFYCQNDRIIIKFNSENQ